MINFEQLSKLQPALIDLSRLIDYPDAQTFSNQAKQDLFANYPDTSQRQKLFEIFNQLSEGTVLDQQAHYANLFEMNKRYTLYMSYYKLQDSRERGTVLAKLKMLYEMFGVSIEGSELSDYLPMMLEFLAYGDSDGDYRKQDFKLAFQVIEDGTFELLKNAQAEIDDPYFQLIKVIRAELRSCIEMEVSANG